MATIEHKLSNVLLSVPAHTADFPSMYFIAREGVRDVRLLDHPVSFMTYFGACSLAKWKRYAQVDNVHVRLRASGGAFDAVLLGFSHGDERNAELARFSFPAAAEAAERTISFPETDKQLVAFEIVPQDAVAPVALHGAYYFTRVDEAQVNPVRLALATTTFRKEQYVVPNIRLVRDEVLASDDPIAHAFHMFVVDNGRTLDAAALSGDGVTVLPNANVGGAGGFARGMMAALDGDVGGGGGPGASSDSAESRPFTHVLLMDDDVIVSPESFKRTFNLLALARGRYREAFVNGAMLAMERPNVQTEDVACVHESGGYSSVKGDALFVDRAEQIALNEELDVEVPRAYGAWWYSCIPLARVRAVGLPLPVFVRCDDVEFGMRSQPTYMTMNGICVWHEGFGDRFRPSVDCYQYVRNFLIMNAVDECSSDAVFMARMRRIMRLHLRLMAYDAVELFLDGIEDYLKGPEFLVQADGEAIMRANGARNEKLVPIAQLPADVRARLAVDPAYLQVEPRSNLAVRLWRTLPYDRHLLPDFLLRDRPVAVAARQPARLTPKATATAVLVAMDQAGETAAVRRMDKARWRAIKRRRKRIMADYKQRSEQVKAAWRAAMPHLTSRAFWNGYLAARNDGKM